MLKRRSDLLVMGLALGWFAVSASRAYAEGLVPCDGLSCQFCSLGQLVQHIINFMIGVSIPISAGLFAYAGFQYATAGGSQGKIDSAHEIFGTVGIGFIIVVSAWLVINTVLVVLLDGPNKPYSGGKWFTLQCVEQGQRQTKATPAQLLNDLLSANTGQVNGTIDVGALNGVAVGPLTQCPAQNTSCSPSALQQAGFTPEQAAVMSCVAVTESSGNSSIVNPQGQACGTFQILPSNWQKPALHTGSCSVNSSCTDPICNAQTAQLLVQQRVQAGQSPYSDWTCPNCNSKAAACVQQFGGQTTQA